jgi:hypothetical protein
MATVCNDICYAIKGFASSNFASNLSSLFEIIICFFAIQSRFRSLSSTFQLIDRSKLQEIVLKA